MRLGRREFAFHELDIYPDPHHQHIGLCPGLSDFGIDDSFQTKPPRIVAYLRVSVPVVPYNYSEGNASGTQCCFYPRITWKIDVGLVSCHLVAGLALL